MLNLQEIKSNTIAELKAFCTKNNIEINGDRRLRATFETAIALWQSAKELAKETIDGAIECVQEIATYDNALIAANFVNVWTRRGIAFTLRSLWSLFLVTIAIAYCGYRLWNDRENVRVRVYDRALEIRDTIAKHWHILRMTGCGLLYLHVETPVRRISDLAIARFSVFLPQLPDSED